MKERDFYLKKLGRRGKIRIYLVNGSKVRTTLDREFTNFGQHFRFPCIPKYEFWIDKEAVLNERRFFIDHLLIEWQLMKKGFSYADATDIAEVKERSEREKAGDIKKIIDEKGKIDIEKVHKNLLEKIKNGINVWLIDGRLVRSIFYIEFTEGGHDLVYSFVPKNEVWIDNDLSSKERPYVILHELYERSLMAKGLSYEQAHRKASRLEWQARHHPQKLQESLALLG